jgi:hypothetical protein
MVLLVKKLSSNNNKESLSPTTAVAVYIDEADLCLRKGSKDEKDMYVFGSMFGGDGRLRTG